MQRSLTAAIAFLIVTGCSKSPDPQDKLAEAKKELVEAQQRVAAAQAEAERTVEGTKPAEPSIPPAMAPATKSAPDSPKAPLAGVQSETKAAVAKPAPQPASVTIPAGTAIAIRTTNTLSSSTQKDGEPFAASLNQNLVVDGKTVAVKGAEVSGVIADSDPGGRVKGRASLAVRIKSIAGVNGPIPVTTGSYTTVAKSTVKRDVIRGGIMAGAGAAIGAIAGGGKGAAIGAGAGGAAGAGTAMATRGEAAQIPAESVFTVKTTAPITVTLKPY